MSTNTVCRVCLVDNMNLYRVRNDLQNVYESIAKEKYNIIGYPVHMCYICLTVLRKCHRFMETARDTNNMLKQWYKQQNEMRVARPLFSYSIYKAESVSTYNGSMMLQKDIKVEKVEPEEEVQPEYSEYNYDVNIEKTDIDEQTDYSEVLVDTPNDNTYNDTVEDSNDVQTRTVLNYKIVFEETSSLASHLDDASNVETKFNIILPHDNDAPPAKKRTTNEIKTQHQAFKTTGETEKNRYTSNNIISLSPQSNKNRINTCNNKTTVTPQLTYRNIRIQIKDRPFQCSICEFKFTQKASLARHMSVHTGEKPYSCEVCNYKCAQKSYLVTHMRSHTGEKPFACKLCYFKCTQNGVLVRHMRTHTGEKPFSCDICEFKCSQKTVLVRHMKIHS